MVTTVKFKGWKCGSGVCLKQSASFFCLSYLRLKRKWHNFQYFGANIITDSLFFLSIGNIFFHHPGNKSEGFVGTCTVTDVQVITGLF